MPCTTQWSYFPAMTVSHLSRCLLDFRKLLKFLQESRNAFYNVFKILNSFLSNVPVFHWQNVKIRQRNCPLMRSFFPSGHVCCVWEFWPWCRGPSFGLCSVWPVLPSVLCRYKGMLILYHAAHTTSSIMFSGRHTCRVRGNNLF